MLRNLASDMNELDVTGWRFGLGAAGFYGIYALTWCKAHLWPGKDDMRGAVGVQLLMVQ